MSEKENGRQNDKQNDKQNDRKFDIPGRRDILKAIREINEQVKKIEDEIKEHSSRIHEIIKKEKESSPRNQILLSLNENRTEINAFKDERGVYLRESDEIKKKIETIKTAMGSESGSFMNEEQINQKIEELNLLLIKESLSGTEEKRIANELSALTAKKSKLGDMKENTKLLKVLDARNKELRSIISKINRGISERIEKSNGLKVELDKIHEANKNKHPEIDHLNSKIKQLKETKKKLFDQREEKRGVVHALEVEFKKVEKDILIAKEKEDKKNELRAEIAGKKKEIAEFNKQILEFDAKVFDVLLMTLEAIKMTGNYSLNMSLAAGLLKNGLPLPKNAKTIDETIALTKKARENADSTFEEKTRALKAKIASLEKEIDGINATISEMGESDIELLKKGGYFMKRNNRREQE